MKNRKTIMAIAVAVIISSFFIGEYIFQQQKAKSMNFLAQENSEIFVRDYSPVYGSKDAKVYITEFLDPECESCRRFYPFVKKLLADNPGKLKLVVRYTPYHKNSKFAIRILEATRKQGLYWESLELLFRFQPEWGNHHAPNPELIWSYLPQVGVDVERVRKEMHDPIIEKIIEQDMLDAKRLEVRGTPTFFVNGKPLNKFGYEELKSAVEAELKKVELEN